MFYFDYPKVKQSLVRATLQDPYPAWYLDTQGVIRGANLMAYWLWNELHPGEPVKPGALLGKSIFSIFAHNSERIPVDQNGEFYAKKSAVVKRMNAELGAESTHYTSFIAAMKADPHLNNIYEQATQYADNEWENLIRITPPGFRGSTHTGTEFLEFQVTTFRLERNTGLLATYMPTPATLPVFEEMYSLLVDQYSDRIYMQPDDMEDDTIESNQLPTNLESPYRVYYPSIVQDPLWYISGENKAHRLLVGSSVIGMHFFELFFAPQLREWLGPLQETSAPRAIRYFDVFTVTYLREDHELHAEYEQTMKYLLKVENFRNLLEVSRKLSIRLYLPDNPETSFYTCKVLLPWSFSPEIALQFRSMVRLLHRNLFVHTDIRDYQVTLVPENYETEVALMLLHLFPTAQAPEEEDKSDTTSFMQFLWLLTVMRTVKEGLLREDGEVDMRWEPEPAFGRISKELATKFREDEIDKVITELREIIEMLDSKGMVDKGTLFGMLHSFTSTMRYMDQLSVFLAGEMERHRGIISYRVNSSNC